MKIMIVGAWKWYQYEAAFSKALELNDIEVIKFSTSEFFIGYWGRVQLALPPILGTSLFFLNTELLRKAKKERPDWILFWRPTHVLPKSVDRLREFGIKISSYNNDDPFGPTVHGNTPWHHRFLWFWYLRCISKIDKNFYYRQINCKEAVEFGASNVSLMMPYFIPWRDRPIVLNQAELLRFAADVIFVGHYEPDGREIRIRALMNSGIQVKIYGASKYWSRDILGDLYDRLEPIQPVEGDDYAKALRGAKICLAFLSKLNRDTYTRRCFEIPACGGLMLAERTKDLTNMFIEDEEACFFSSDEELLDKVRWLLANPSIRERIAASGMNRVWKDGHDVSSRAKQFLKQLSSN